MVGWQQCGSSPPEIILLKTRTKETSLATSTSFLGNFLVVEITPTALMNIGYKTYIIFAILNMVNATIVWCFYPETAGQTLESADRLFVDKDGEWEDDRVLGDKVPLFRKAQWKIVRKARLMAKETDGDLREEGIRIILGMLMGASCLNRGMRMRAHSRFSK
jgi:hypothetical protein